MQLAAGVGISGRQEGRSAPPNARDAAAPRATGRQLEGFLQRLGLDASAQGANGHCEQGAADYTSAPPTPPDEPGAMTEQTLEWWSLSDVIGVPRLGRLRSVVQRVAG